VFLSLGEARFAQILRSISMGKLKSYKVYEPLKTRAHLTRLNTESLRKAAPRLWTRLGQGEEEFARDLAQAVLVSHLEMIAAVLDFLGIPHQDGFFDKNLDFGKFLTEDWNARVFDRFRETYPEAVLLFYINHLGWEAKRAAEPFVPAA